MNLTPEQQAIIAHLASSNDDLIIDAKAGSGKTATLLEACRILRGTTTFQAFNKSIAVEIQQRLAKTLDFQQQLNVTSSTVHSHGLSAFRKSGRKVETLTGKVAFITKDYLKEQFHEEDDILRNSHLVRRMVSYAKAAGFGLTSTGEEFASIEDKEAWKLLADHYDLELEISGSTSLETICDAAKDVLKRSNMRTGSVDFDDMIYLPLLMNLPIPTYNNVLIDEAQDINATRRELAFRTVAPGGRIVAVGDPNQAIYGFTGAAVDSLHKIQVRAGALSLPLSICWRCDEAIIGEAQRIVPGIYARPGADEGAVRNIHWDNTPGNPDFLSLPQPGDAILCRLNKPNVAVCLGLLRRGVRARIEGKDLGKKLLDHIQRATDGMYQDMDLHDIRSAMDDYFEIESAKLFAKQREAAIDLLQDEVEAMQLIIDRTIEAEVFRKPTYADVAALVADLFADDIPARGVVTLSSVHKSKGREWPTVFILGRSDYMPFHRATSDWELEQENNLIYVAITRAERLLVNVHGVQSAIDRGLHREVPHNAA